VRALLAEPAGDRLERVARIALEAARTQRTPESSPTNAPFSGR
jgi:hypothetical protein